LNPHRCPNTETSGHRRRRRHDHDAALESLSNAGAVQFLRPPRAPPGGPRRGALRKSAVFVQATFMTATATSYDELPYESNPFLWTHPDRLATIARLFGLQAPPVDHCHVLELGCASGGNLIPMAVNLPQSRFVGVDLSARQIADGQKVVSALGLTNIELKPISISDVDADL